MSQELDALEKIWHATEVFLKKAESSFSQYFFEYQKREFNEWEYLVGSTFHLNLHRLKGIQFLLNPQNSQFFYMEAASLARNLFENWITLAWLNHPDTNKRDERILQFKNNAIVNQAVINQALRFHGQESEDEQWLKEKSQEIRQTTEQWKIPNIEARMTEIASRDSRFKDQVSLYYDTVYRDLSHYVHLSYRTLREMRRSMHSGEIILSLPTSLGFKCIDVGGGFFIFTVEIWNDVFHSVEESTLSEWANDWLCVQTETRQEISIE